MFLIFIVTLLLFAFVLEGLLAKIKPRNKANELGLAATDIALCFGQFGAAAAIQGLSLEKTREVFTQITEAVAEAGIVGEQARNVLKGFIQVMWQGTLSIEEVKQQIGEVMPHSIDLLAKAIGKTVPEMFEMMENRELLSKNVLPKWAAALSANVS